MGRLSTKQATYLGAMGALSFALAFLLGGAINALTGIPLTGGIVNGIVVGAMLTIGVRGVDKFWSATIIWLVFSVFAIPTITLGPPGWYKVIVGVLVGVMWDAIIGVFRRTSFGYILGAGIGAVGITVGVFVAASLLGLPAAGRLAKALVFLVPLNLLISMAGGWVGLRLFDRYFASSTFMRGLRSK